ncbi:hypothetical protein [Hyalangium rubrum]|uniref:Glycosyltransferase n=1 Tax=Hyalangium rubrum TaxID=3103134 RepID=A0ABU5GX98_9BACT|nr:hypothetical protein [Hyalangium sp. s54d21]MDY7225716.1 hypothetical protein [Hyalangium sp. s54d21]
MSEDNAEYLRFGFPHLRIARVHQGLDPTVFHPPAQPAGRRIALMTRNYARDTVQVVQLLRARGSLAGWELVIIKNRTPQQTADLMRQSAIFLAPSNQEGFGRIGGIEGKLRARTGEEGPRRAGDRSRLSSEPGGEGRPRSPSRYTPAQAAVARGARWVGGLGPVG